MAITLQQAQANLDAWVAASTALAAGKEHRVHNRMLRLEDADKVREMIEFWSAQVTKLTNAANFSGSGGYALASFPGE